MPVPEANTATAPSSVSPSAAAPDPSPQQSAEAPSNASTPVPGAAPGRDVRKSGARFVVFGAGAVGTYFGAQLARAGVPVTLVARPSHVAAIQRDGLVFESKGRRVSIPIKATTDPTVVADASIVLLCVKSRDTLESGRTLAKLLKPDATVVSLQNGVDNVPRLRQAGVDALAAVVYVATAMVGPGHVVHSGRGDLIVGEFADREATSEPSARAQRIAQALGSAGIPCEVTADIRPASWKKLVMNCAYNALSALGTVDYASMLGDEAIRAAMRSLIEECHAVARAEGVAQPAPEALYDAAIELGQSMGAATSSTAQDLAARRPTEIDDLNGHVAARAAAHGLAAPWNATVAALVRMREKAVLRG